MSMTYYAVTDDPNELTHWGIKGMKWGVRHDKPRHTGSSRKRSAAYKKAQSKLSKMMKSGIKKAEAHWRAYNSPKAKEERFMQKAMQKARTGTLKYGKLTDDQVRRVTERLALERNARQLGSTENPRFIKRLKSAVGEGVLKGTTSYIDARMRVRGQTKGEDAAAKRREKYNSKASVQRKRAINKLNEEYYNTAVEEGNDPYKYRGPKKRSEYLSEVKERRANNEYSANVRKTYSEQGARTKAIKDVNTPVSIYDPNTKTIIPATRYDIEVHNSTHKKPPRKRPGRR